MAIVEMVKVMILTHRSEAAQLLETLQAEGIVQVLDAEYYFVKLTDRKFFGWQQVEIEDHIVRISDPEKTVADCLDHPEHCGGIDQIARAVYFSHEEINLKRMVEYAQRMGNRTIIKRLGRIMRNCLKATSPLQGSPGLTHCLRKQESITASGTY